MDRVGRAGVVTMEESRTAEDHLYVVEGMQFDRGYISPYFVTDPERMVRRPDAFREQTLTMQSPGGRLCLMHVWPDLLSAGSVSRFTSHACSMSSNWLGSSVHCHVEQLRRLCGVQHLHFKEPGTRASQCFGGAETMTKHCGWSC